MFCCRRRESLDLDQSEDAEAIPTGEVFTVSGQVPVPPNTARTVPQYSDRNAPVSKRPVLAGDVESVATRTTADAEKEAGTRRIVFGRERARVLDLLRRRTAELCVYLKQKVHTRTLNIDNSSHQDGTADVHVLSQLQAPTHSPGNIGASTLLYSWRGARMGWMPTTVDPVRSQELLLAHPVSPIYFATLRTQYAAGFRHRPIPTRPRRMCQRQQLAEMSVRPV